jgi:hypothetical protein
MTKWLLQVTAYRERLEPDDRYEALLWSWPIRRVLSKASSLPLWDCARDDDETLERKGRAAEGLQYLATNWYPVEPPMTISDLSFQKRCTVIYEDLLALNVAHEDLEGPKIQGFLAEFIEKHWGDGEHEGRCGMFSHARKQIEKKHWRQVYHILEQARDHAYLYMQTTRHLDAMRATKKRLETFLVWLREASHQEDFIEEQLGPVARSSQPDESLPTLEFVFREDITAFYDAFRAMLAHKRGAREFLVNGLKSALTYEGRDTRERVGNPTHELTFPL